MVIGSGPGENLQLDILLVQGSEEIADLLLAHGVRKVVIRLVDEFRRDIGIEIVEAGNPDSLQHRADVLLRVRKIRESAHLLYSPMCFLYAAESIRESSSLLSLILTLMIQLA